MLRALACSASCLFLVACGHEPDRGDDPERTELRIDMRPLDSITASGVLTPDAQGVLRTTESIDLAWGGGYPRELTVALGQPWATCGSLQGTFTIDTVENEGDGIEVTMLGGDALALAPAREGDFHAVVRGTFVADAPETSCVGAQAEFEYAVDVRVRTPFGVVVARPSACAESQRFVVESDAKLSDGAFVRLVDAAGEAFIPDNAESNYPADLVLTAEGGTALALHEDAEGLAALVVSGAPGPVSVWAFDAIHETIDHVAPESIDVVGVQFELLGFAGGTTPLATGEVYGANGWARTSASIGIASSGLEVGGEQVCTLPREDGFVLASSTPQTCTTYEDVGHGNGPNGATIFDPPLQLSGEVIASGVCTLALDGPDYGFSTSLSVEILNAESLFHLEGR